MKPGIRYVTPITDRGTTRYGLLQISSMLDPLRIFSLVLDVDAKVQWVPLIRTGQINWPVVNTWFQDGANQDVMAKKILIVDEIIICIE